jgi:membrane associated rhomboid family serine protease
MGLYDRDYYRNEGPSYLGSFIERGKVCKWLVAINVAVFILQMLLTQRGQSDPITEHFSLNAESVLHGQVWQLLTYAFLHTTSSPWHILFNMLFLWWFGSDVEDLYGPREFLLFYLAAAMFGGVVHVLLYCVGWIPPVHVLEFGEAVAVTPIVLGASGAVAAVLLLCAFHFPTRIIYVFMLFPVPIWLFLVFIIGLDLFTFLGRQRTGVAVDVHLAGALFAFLYYRRHWRLSTLWPDLKAWRRRRSAPRLRVYRGEDEMDREPVAAAVGASAIDDEQLEAKMDAILEKIARSGKDSLTDSEKDVLLKASELIRRRRR